MAVCSNVVELGGVSITLRDGALPLALAAKRVLAWDTGARRKDQRDMLGLVLCGKQSSGLGVPAGDQLIEFCRGGLDALGADANVGLSCEVRPVLAVIELEG